MGDSARLCVTVWKDACCFACVGILSCFLSLSPPLCLYEVSADELESQSVMYPPTSVLHVCVVSGRNRAGWLGLGSADV